MLSLGLGSRLLDERPSINKNLLLLKLNVFRLVYHFVYQAPSRLFPSLQRLNIVHLANSPARAGPVNCAADDLELSLNGPADQIEFYSAGDVAHAAPPADEFFFSYSTPHQPQQAPVWPEDASHAYDHLDNLTFDQLYDFLFAQPAQKQVSQQSHFSLNMIGLNHQRAAVPASQMVAFNDFKRPHHGSTSSSASSDSFVSPLDDDFYKKMAQTTDQFVLGATPGSRKRKLNKPVETPPLLPSSTPLMSLEVDTLFNDMLARNAHQDFHYMPPKPVVFDQVLPAQQPLHKKVKVELAEVPSEEPFKLYQCSECLAKFKVKSYLTRHLKKHSSAKAFQCPFYHEPSDVLQPTGTKCHPTGGFSRRDTYKTHLKALHFIYPPGTKLTERNSIGGRCAGCFRFFDNNSYWLENHIESYECKGTVLFKKMADALVVKLEPVEQV